MHLDEVLDEGAHAEFRAAFRLNCLGCHEPPFEAVIVLTIRHMVVY